MSMSFLAEFSTALDTYTKELDEVAEETLKEVAREAANRLRNDSPKRPGDGEYAKGWAVKTEGRFTRIVYNKTKPGLTHLIENGHVSRNQYGTYGRVNGVKHIEPVEQWANEELQRRLESKL